jgi:hypothetical protein
VMIIQWWREQGLKMIGRAVARGHDRTRRRTAVTVTSGPGTGKRGSDSATHGLRRFELSICRTIRWLTCANSLASCPSRLLRGSCPQCRVRTREVPEPPWCFVVCTGTGAGWNHAEACAGDRIMSGQPEVGIANRDGPERHLTVLAVGVLGWWPAR